MNLIAMRKRFIMIDRELLTFLLIGSSVTGLIYLIYSIAQIIARVEVMSAVLAAISIKLDIPWEDIEEVLNSSKKGR